MIENKKRPKTEPASRSNVVAHEVVRAEADALRALYSAHVAAMRSKGKRVTQEAFAAENGLGVQGMLWQYLNGRSPLNVAAAAKFAKGLGCRIEDFSPRLAAVAIRAAQVVDDGNARPGSAASELHALLDHILSRSSADAAPRIRAVLELIAGTPVSDDEVERRMPITRSLKQKPKAPGD